jgi:hypothetical protein
MKKMRLTALDKKIKCYKFLIRGFMTDTAQIDRIISEVNDLEEEGKILFFHKIEEIFGNFSGGSKDDDIPIESVFGLWKGRNITKEALRRKAWMQN